MKEVKHRVWDKVNSEWLEYTCRTVGWLSHPVDRPSIPEKTWVYKSPNGWGFSDFQWCLDHPEDFGVDQYIGFKDDFGEEVYSEDCCEVTVNNYYSDNNLTLEEGDVFRGIVKMVDYMWVVQDADKTEIPFYSVLCEEMDIRVIGNSYEDKVDEESEREYDWTGSNLMGGQDG